MRSSKEQLLRWGQALCQSISVGGLISRCPIAHKWKAPYRCLVVREALLWRMHDLGEQIIVLYEQQHILGARILLRSAIETLALLIYLNQKISAVLEGSLSFFEFDRLTIQLLMGSKNNVTDQAAVNILTVLEKADRKHSGLSEIHQRLSESAHPNYDGVVYGYSSSDPVNYETNFLNRWAVIFGAEQEPYTDFVFAVFEDEYNKVYPELIEKLESWLRDNDSELEQQRNGI